MIAETIRQDKIFQFPLNNKFDIYNLCDIYKEPLDGTLTTFMIWWPLEELLWSTFLDTSFFDTWLPLTS